MSHRAKNVNKEQKDILIEYMRKHPKLISGKFTKDFSYKDAQKLWNEVADCLNSVPNGGKKQWNQWRKVWQDMRTKSKSKKAKIVNERNETGGGIPETDNLTNTENAVLDLMSPVLWSGIGQVTESTIEGFDQTELIPNSESELIPAEILLENRTNNVETTEILTGATTQFSDSESQKISIDNTPRRKKRKLEHMSETVKAAKAMENIAKKKLEIKEHYYEEKLKLMKRDIEIKEQHLKFICNKMK